MGQTVLAIFYTLALWRVGLSAAPEFVLESARAIPVACTADVVVVGSGTPGAPAAILPKARLLDWNQAFSHHRAVALALESVGDPAAAPALAEMLKGRNMRGYAVASAVEADERDAGERNLKRGKIEWCMPSLRELTLARALFRCGDEEGLGRAILNEHAHDVRGRYARHAQAVLAQGPRRLTDGGVDSETRGD